MRIVAVLAVLLVAACSSPATVATNSPSASARATATSAATASPTSASPAPQPSMPTAPPATVSCLTGVIPAAEALIGGGNAEVLYDVSDPLHPRAVCRLTNTWAHIVTGTAFEYVVPRADGMSQVVLHALGSNNETVVATVKADIYHAYESWYQGLAWDPNSGTLGYLDAGGKDANGLDVTDVWLATATTRTKVYSYSVPGKDAFGRPGFAPQTMSFSPDGAYVAAGWSVATTPPRVFRVADGVAVGPAPPLDFRFAFWAKTGDTLYLVGYPNVYQWSPGGQVTTLPSTQPWTLDPNFSPNGQQVAFTVVTTTHQVRPYVYDTQARTTQLLVDQPRSSALFVKTGWIWEAEEKPCVPSSNHNCFDPTEPDGTILALDLATGHETAVTFAAGEAPAIFGLAERAGLWPAG